MPIPAGWMELAAEGGLSLKLTDYAIPIPAFLWMKLDDEVKVHFRFVAARQSAATSGEAPPSCDCD